MPGLTPNQNYPYPLDTELHDVAGDMENLARAIDTDIADALATVLGKVDRGGDTMTGMLTLPGTMPSSLNHAARKGYVDTQDEQRLATTGGAMTGDIAMGGNKVTGLALPTGAADATRKSYVDDAVLNAVQTDIVATQIMVGTLRAPRFTVGDLTPDNLDELTSKQYVDETLNEVMTANVAVGTQTKGILIQADMGLATLDVFAVSVVNFVQPFAFAPIVTVSAANSTMALFAGIDASEVTSTSMNIYGKHLSDGTAAAGVVMQYEWIAVGYAL